MPLQPLPALLSIHPYKGGDFSVPGVAHPVKLSSNENPFGPSPKAKAAYIAAADELHIYPDGAAGRLRAAVAGKFGLEPERLFFGAGSDEAFFLVARAFLAPGDEVVVSQYGFSIHALASLQVGAVLRAAPERDFTVDIDAMLAAVSPKTKIVFLANPNNPTGTCLPFAEVERLHRGLSEDVLLVLDSAYAEFVRRSDYDSGLELARRAPNVLVTRTFSKAYGLAALRLGWGYGPPIVIDALNRARGPFNTSAPAIAAGVAALGDEEFLERTIAHNAHELPRVTAALQALGLKVSPSAGNFVLVHFAPGEADKADAYLRARGYILRALKPYQLPDALRFSLGTAEQNDGALAALADFVRAA